MLCRDDQCSVHASVNAHFTTNTALWGQKHNTATVAGAAGAEHYHLGAGKKLNKELGVFIKVVPPLFARAADDADASPSPPGHLLARSAKMTN
jgi:hypothetical protein